MSLPNDVTMDIKQCLLDQAIGSSVGSSDWFISRGMEPTSPDRVITITQFPGAISNPKFLMDVLNVQIRIRGKSKDYVAAQSKAQEIKDGLLGLSAKTIGNSRYYGIWEEFPGMGFLRYDESNRPIFITTFRIEREPSNSSTESNREKI